MGFTATTKKLNNNYTVIPISYLGKKKTAGSEKFLCNGERLNASEIQTLGIINKFRNMYGSFARIPYGVFTDSLGVSRPTVCQALKHLRERNIIERRGQSDYYIMPEIKDKSYLIIYDFLMTEELNLTGVPARIRGNAVLLLCTIISHYLNPKKKGQYFAGGLSCVAAHLNVATSTADYAIKKLVSVGAIKIKTVTYDKGVEIIADGKFNGGKLVYVVDERILNRCRDIRKAAEKHRKNDNVATSRTAGATGASSPKRKERRGVSKRKAIQKQKDNEIYQELYNKLNMEDETAGNNSALPWWDSPPSEPPDDSKADK